MSDDLSTRITVEIERRLKSHSGEVDYFICLMAQNDAQSQARIAALESEVCDLRAALEAMMEGSKWRDTHIYEHDNLTIPAGWHTIRMPSSEALDKARAALNR